MRKKFLFLLFFLFLNLCPKPSNTVFPNSLEIKAASAQAEAVEEVPKPKKKQSFIFYLITTGGWVVGLLMLIGVAAFGISIESEPNKL